MTTTTGYVPPAPTGSEWVDDWEGEGHDRGRFFSHPSIDVCELTLTIRGVQWTDGKTGRSILVKLDPSLEGGAGADFTPVYARKLAAMLQNFADTCEILDGLER